MYLRLILLFVLPIPLLAQDAYLQHFYNNETSFNPAFSGQRGALRMGFSFREQWGAETADQYRSRKLTVEESLPCLPLDYALFARQDQEGAGQLTTNEFGGSTAAVINIQSKHFDRYDKLNIRIGLGFTFGQRSVDFDRLNFLDQIDPFFGLNDADGNLNSSGFIPPGGTGESSWYSSQSLGISLKGGFNSNSNYPISFDVGLAVHNPGFFVSPDSRQTASLLGLDNRLGERFVFSATGEFVIARKRRRIWSVRPVLVVQQQEQLGYLEVGAGVSWNKSVTFGAYHHVARPSSMVDGSNVNWTSAQVEIGAIMGEDGSSRVDLAFSYAFQHGFLKNFVRPPLEVTATFSFGQSSTCALLGAGEAAWLSKRGKTDCYAFTSARNKLYDNIWYKADR